MRIAHAFAILATAFTVCGVTSHAALAQPQVAAESAAASRLNVIYVTQKTKRDLKIDNVNFRDGGPLPSVHIDVFNPTTTERRYEYKLEWLDADGVGTQTVTTWRSLIVVPKEHQEIVSVGQTPRAYKARLTIKETARK